MFAKVSLVFALVCITSAFAAPSFVYVAASANGRSAQLMMLSAADGAVVARTNLSYYYTPPLLQAHYLSGQDVYAVVLYSDDTNGAAYYSVTDSSLRSPPGGSCLNAAGDIFFEVQYSDKLRKSFGIFGKTQFDRSFSELHFGVSSPCQLVGHKTLFTLPADGSMKSSTYATSSDRYFGLINKRPGPNTTYDLQRLLVGTLGAMTFNIVNLARSSDGAMFTTITWSESSKVLFGLLYAYRSVVLVAFDTFFNNYIPIVNIPDVYPGPIAADATERVIYLFLKKVNDGGITFYRYDLLRRELKIVSQLPPSITVVSAAVVRS